MKVKYHNPVNIIERQKIRSIFDKGHAIVCASHSIPGDNIWIDKSSDYCHWATGDFYRYSNAWSDLGALIVELVDNDILLKIAREKHRRLAKNPSWVVFNPVKWDDMVVKYTSAEIIERLVGKNLWHSAS